MECKDGLWMNGDNFKMKDICTAGFLKMVDFVQSLESGSELAMSGK